MEDRESSNSCTIDEIPLTLGFNSQMIHAKDVESPKSHAIVEIDLDDIPSTTSFDSKVPHSRATKVNPISCDF